MKTLLQEKLQQNHSNHCYQVDFYRSQCAEDASDFERLISDPAIRISDTLPSQLQELVKALHPKQRLSSAQMEELVKAHLGSTEMYLYGVWVYYPWLQKVVHMLDEEEFVLLRTNRNQYKISPDEKEKMAKAKIGVLGLSVGQSVAMALTMERCYGELRIADFDTLDLSNLNRIRSGVQDLGLLKTVSTARQIAEIDPFLKVTCYHQGVNDENMDAFLLEGGKLDILIDECDGFNVKILARQRAKAFQIPVLMETSDRCMLDIERFDLEPQRPILHGLIEHLDLDYHRLSALTMEQKVGYIMPILGVETMSAKIKASMLEIDQSITTWPQLASDVIMGGAVTANVCRRIVLDSLQCSGRFFLDLDELIAPEKEFFKMQNTIGFENKETVSAETEAFAQVSFERSAEDYLHLSSEQAESIIQAAILAPSGGNSQPWKFVYQHQQIWCMVDPTRARSFLDYRGMGSLVAMGAAIENICLKAESLQLQACVHLFPNPNPLIVAAIGFKHLACVSPYAHLKNTISKRLTYRKNAPRAYISPELLQNIQAYGESLHQNPVIMITDTAKLKSIGQILGKVDYHLLTNPLGHQGFMSEVRWTEQEAKQTADGIDIATVDISKGEQAAFEMAKDWKVIQKLIDWNGGEAFEKMAQKSVDSASAIGLLTLKGFAQTDFVHLGQATQRLWLYANEQGLALQPLSPITFLFYRWLEGNGEGLLRHNIEALQEIYPTFRQLFDLPENVYPGFLFRLVVPDGEVLTSYRRPLQDVFRYMPHF